MSEGLPRYITVRGLCKALNGDRVPLEWRPQRVANILRGMGILRKVGHYLAFLPEDLAGAWPEAYEELLTKLSELKPYVREQPARAAKIASRQKSGNSGSEQKYDYDAHPCSYEVGAGWSCGPECADPRHK